MSGSKKARNTAARLVAVQCVYDMTITGHSVNEALEAYRDHRHDTTFEDIEFVPADLELLSGIVRGVADRRTELVDMVQGALDSRKGTSQPEIVLRSILLCGAYEMLAHPELESGLIIAEYMAVSNGFFDDAQAKLVNAVLDRLSKALRA